MHVESIHWKNHLMFHEIKPYGTRVFWEHLLDLIQQSKCDLTDVDRAILTSKVKKTSTCCVIIRKGTFYHNLKRIAALSEKRNALFLLLCLFKQGYQRKIVDNNPAKWWNAEF